MMESWLKKRARGIRALLQVVVSAYLALSWMATYDWLRHREGWLVAVMGLLSIPVALFVWAEVLQGLTPRDD